MAAGVMGRGDDGCGDDGCVPCLDGGSRCALVWADAQARRSALATAVAQLHEKPNEPDRERPGSAISMSQLPAYGSGYLPVDSVSRVGGQLGRVAGAPPPARPRTGAARVAAAAREPDEPDRERPGSAISMS
jgi:hypothetical protein